MSGYRSRALVYALRRAGPEGLTVQDLVETRYGARSRWPAIHGMLKKLRDRHGIAVENLNGIGRGSLGRYRLAESVILDFPKRVPRSTPGQAPCRCEMLAPRRCPRCIMLDAIASGRSRRSGRASCLLPGRRSKSSSSARSSA